MLPRYLCGDSDSSNATGSSMESEPVDQGCSLNGAKSIGSNFLRAFRLERR